jgi:hypothetical protein
MRPFNGYPDAWGSKPVSIFPHSGPASYTQVTNGTPPVVGGDVVTAAEAGMKNFDLLSDGVTDSGRFRVEAIPVTSSVTGQNSSSLSGIPATTYRLRWIATFTGAFGGQAQVVNTEAIAATNLSTETVRLQGFGVSK